MLRIVHLISHNQGQQRHSLACPRRHLQNTMAAGIERFFSSNVSHQRLKATAKVATARRHTFQSTHVPGKRNESAFDQRFVKISFAYSYCSVLELEKCASMALFTLVAVKLTWIYPWIWKQNGQITSCMLTPILGQDNSGKHSLNIELHLECADAFARTTELKVE